MYDTAILASDPATEQWTPAYGIEKGSSVSISIKGTFTGTVYVRRWLQEYGADLPDDATEAAKHIGIIQSYTSPIESVDISGGTYFYQVGTDGVFVGTAYVHIQ